MKFLAELIDRIRNRNCVIQKNNIVHGNICAGDIINGENKNPRKGTKVIQKNIVAHGDICGGDVIVSIGKDKSKKNKMIINGKPFPVEGSDVSILNGCVSVNNTIIGDKIKGDVHIIWEGEPAKVFSKYSFECHGNVLGNVDCDGNISCKNVHGDVYSNGNVECGNVEGDIEAGGNVMANNIEGDVDAVGNVIYNGKKD